MISARSRLLPVLFVACSTVIATTVLGALAASDANAQEAGVSRSSSPPTIDPEAKAVLEQIANAEYNLSSYSSTFVTTVRFGDYAINGHGTLCYARPNKAFAHTTRDSHEETIICDGAQRIEFTDGAKKYTTKSASGGVENILAVMMRSGASAGTLVELVMQPQAAAEIVRPGMSLRRAPDEIIDGIPVDVIEFTRGQAKGDRIRYTIAAGKQDHLLRRVSYNGDTATGTETYTNVIANPSIPASKFVFTPKPGLTATAPDPTPPLFDPRVKVGAIPFSFTVKDMQGHPHSLRAYKGKVLLVDFWAMNFIMDPNHIPAIVAAYDKYHLRGFEVLGIEMDAAKDRTNVLQFTRDNHMAWPQIFDGKYWGGHVADIYHLNAPRLWVLVGRNGKIVTVDPTNEELDPAVEKALAQ